MCQVRGKAGLYIIKHREEGKNQNTARKTGVHPGGRALIMNMSHVTHEMDGSGSLDNPEKLHDMGGRISTPENEGGLTSLDTRRTLV
jgi:hypothetical protein